MAVRPVEFQGMIQNTHEVAQARNNEQNRPQLQQNHAAIANQQQAEVATTTVSGSQESAKDTFDPSDGGDGTGYQGNRNRKNTEKEKKKEKVPDGVIRAKNPHGSFNISI